MIVEGVVQGPAPVEADDELTHIVCEFTDEDTALCGKDMSGREWLPWADYPDDCLVCVDLAEGHVETCMGEHR